MRKSFISQSLLLKALAAGCLVSALPWLIVWVNTNMARIFPLPVVSGALWAVNALGIFVSVKAGWSERGALIFTVFQWSFIFLIIFGMRGFSAKENGMKRNV